MPGGAGGGVTGVATVAENFSSTVTLNFSLLRTLVCVCVCVCVCECVCVHGCMCVRWMLLSNQVFELE